ncbi:MAG: DUF4321 domain-containing protein [Firmicutes bacterium]|nr:DUF4321 domain-containing protein [Bacillota bacterium]MCL5058682.1 DUF4321 domain-containing protein [Actinomycetota bacterium]
MMASFKGSKNIGVLILLLLIGGLAGSAAADAVSPYLHFVKSTARIGFDPTTLDLHFMTFTVGFKMTLSPLTALGLIVGYWVYRKL